MDELDIAVLVVAYLMGLAIAWINLGDQVTNFAVGIVLMLVVVVVGLSVLKALVPDLNATPGDPVPTGGRIDWVIGEWTGALIKVIASQSPIAFWGGILGGVGTFWYWKNHRASG
jgi:hypothetical protein